MSAASAIWVLGGTGDVGLKLARLLDFGQPDARQVVLASRNASKHRKSANQFGGNTKLVDLDVRAPLAIAAIPENAVVVNLTEATPPAFICALVEKGVRFVESSASPNYLAELEAILTPGEFSGMVVLYAGVAPGLTNLVAKDLLETAPDAVRIDLCGEMGMGRHYGVAATEWFLKTSGQSYPVVIDGKKEFVNSGDLSRRVSFAAREKPRLVLGFGFAEQMHIAQRYSLLSVRNFIGFDPQWMTYALKGALFFGLGRRIANNAKWLTGWMDKMPGFGKMRTRIVGEAFCKQQNLRARIEIETGDQAMATAVILALLAKKLAEPTTVKQTKIHDITDVIALETAIQALTETLPDTTIRRTGERKIADAI